MRSGWGTAWVALGAVAVFAAACGRAAFDEGTTGVTPTVGPTTGTPSSTPTGPTPTPTPDVRFGNGQDGALAVPAPTQVNVCRPLSSSAGATLTVDLSAASTEFKVNRLVFAYQVQDVFATSGDITPVANAGMAGAWEIHRITAISGAGASTVLTLDSNLTAAYQTGGGGAQAQVCTVPEYTSVTIAAGGRIDAAPWNGTTGGVAVVFAQTTLTVTGAINADAAGFRGGSPSGDTGSNDVTSEDTNANDGGGKGEGLDSSSLGGHGRGNFANGAGGGNSRNAGGGGGANGGAGGLGGTQADAFNNIAATAGRGAAPVLFDAVTHASLGGGGGAGQQDNNQGGVGGIGGGLLIVYAHTLSGAGSIRANGQSFATVATLGSFQDGAGGGGAGGTIVVKTAALASGFTGSLTARGGDGGNVDRNNNTVYGPGGGGGGGVINAPTIPAAAAVNAVTAGAAGQNKNADKRGATAGLLGTATVGL